MKTSFFKRAVLSLTAITSLSLSARADVAYTFSPVTSTNGYTLNAKITITGIDVVNYYGPGNFQYNIKLTYDNTITGSGSNGRFYTYDVFFGKDNNFFQSAQSTSAIPVNTRTGTMTSYGPNNGTSTKVTGTGLYTSDEVINEIMNGLKLAVNAPGINSTTLSGTMVNNSAPLPVTFSKFAATVKGQNTLLQWETASEQNNKGFEVERSNDGATWSAVGFVATQAANGNSKATLAYTFSDANTGSKAYYRLKQIDLNAAYEYSAIVAVEGVKAGQATVSVYPNPTSGNISLSGLSASEQVYVYNNLGQVQQVATQQNAQQVNLNLSNLSNGIYYIQAGQEKFKVVLQK